MVRDVCVCVCLSCCPYDDEQLLFLKRNVSYYNASCLIVCSDEEEIRIEELIKSVDMSTVCIPIGTRARMVKANLTAGSSLSKSSTKVGFVGSDQTI